MKNKLIYVKLLYDLCEIPAFQMGLQFFFLERVYKPI